MRPFLRYAVELPGPALQPGPAAHNLEIAPIGVHIHDRSYLPDKQWKLLPMTLPSWQDEAMTTLHALVVYVPDTHTEALLAAIGDAGAGRIGNYSHCAFTSPGTGRFTPLRGAEPFIGAVGAGERVPETRVECVVEEEMLDAVVLALRGAHPYEEPAFMTWPVDGWRR